MNQDATYASQSAPSPLTINVRQFIDVQPFSNYQIMIMVVCAFLVGMDGFDALAMGFTAPTVARQLHISKMALGQLLSSGLVGMMIGALVFGPVADRIGRKPVMIGCTLLFGVASVLTAFCESFGSLMIYRFVTGIGLGGVMPNAIALTAEYMPFRFRATGTTIMFSGFALGGAVGGYVSATLIVRFGWPSVFVVGGIVPIAIALVALVMLPESARFLVLKGGEERRLAAYLQRIAPQADLRQATLVLEERRATGFKVKHLFTEGRTKLTLLLWCIFFMNLLDLYFLLGWLPTMFFEAGISVKGAILITTVLQVGGTLGCPLMGRMIDRRRSYMPLAALYLGAAFFIFLIGRAGSSILLLVLTIFPAGFCVIGAQTNSNTLAAEAYPTSIRSTGVGWALGIGRIGSILGPILGGVLLSLGGNPRNVIWAASIPALLACIAAYAVARHLAQATEPDPVAATAAAGK